MTSWQQQETTITNSCAALSLQQEALPWSSLFSQVSQQKLLFSIATLEYIWNTFFFRFYRQLSVQSSTVRGYQHILDIFSKWGEGDEEHDGEDEDQDGEDEDRDGEHVYRNGEDEDVEDDLSRVWWSSWKCG